MSVAKECGCSVTRQIRVRDEGGKWGVGGGRVNKCLQFHFREYYLIAFFLENLV